MTLRRTHTTIPHPRRLIILTHQLFIMNLIQRRHRRNIPPQNLRLHIPRQLRTVVTRKVPVTHVEHGIELLERQVLRFRQQEVAVHPAKEVPRRVPSEGALFREGIDERGPCQRQNEVEAPARCGREGHAHVAQMQGECFGAVGEGHGTLAGRVHRHEDVYGSGDGSEARGRGLVFSVKREVKGHAAPEEADAHKGKGGKEEVPAAESVDCVDGGDGEEEVCYAGAHAGQEGIWPGEAGLSEDFRCWQS